MSSASEILALVDKHAPAQTATTRIGLTATQVRAALSQSAPADVATVRRAAARAALQMQPKGKWHGVRLPDYVVRAMYLDYLQLGSTYRVGALYGRSGVAIQMAFRRRGLSMPNGTPRESRTHGGIVYYRPRGAFGCFRAKVAGRVIYLHRMVWEAAHGPVPAGCLLVFLNGDQGDVREANLACMTRRDAASFIRRRALARRARKAA